MLTHLSWVALLLMATPCLAFADVFSFEGDTIQAELSSPVSGFVSVPFAPSAVVGAGPEFNGVIGTGEFQWNVSVDVTGREIAISVASVTGSWQSDVPWSIRLTDLDFTAPANPGSIQGLAEEGALPYSVRFYGSNITSTPDSAFIPYDIEGDFVEQLLVISTAPEPSVGLLAGLALIVCGIARTAKITRLG